MADGPKIGSDFTDSATLAHPPVNRCIYCGLTPPILRPEHIVPLSFGSSWELPRASCEDCMKITGKFEQTCARDMFGDVRAQWGIRSRKKKDRRERFAKGLSNPLKLAGVQTPNPLGPFGPLAMPLFEQPGILSERRKTEAIPVVGVEIVFPAIQGTEQPAKEAKGTLHHYHFARMLAKIAYAAAVAVFGYDNTPKNLPSYIRGIDPYISHVVGGCPYPLPKHPPMIVAEGGRINIEPFRVSPGIWRGNGRQLVVSRVQLFRFLDAPTYWVVVGDANDDLIIRIEGSNPV